MAVDRRPVSPQAKVRAPAPPSATLRSRNIENRIRVSSVKTENIPYSNARLSAPWIKRSVSRSSKTTDSAQIACAVVILTPIATVNRPVKLPVVAADITRYCIETKAIPRNVTLLRVSQQFQRNELEMTSHRRIYNILTTCTSPDASRHRRNTRLSLPLKSSHRLRRKK